MARGDWLRPVSVAWMAFWGAVALDSALTYRKSLEAVERAVDADPVQEMYDGPPKQPAQLERWLLWREPTVARLRELSRRAHQMSKLAPVIAVAGPALLLAFCRRGRRDA